MSAVRRASSSSRASAWRSVPLSSSLPKRKPPLNVSSASFSGSAGAPMVGRFYPVAMRVDARARGVVRLLRRDRRARSRVAAHLLSCLVDHIVDFVAGFRHGPVHLPAGLLRGSFPLTAGSGAQQERGESAGEEGYLRVHLLLPPSSSQRCTASRSSAPCACASRPDGAGHHQASRPSRKRAACV